MSPQSNNSGAEIRINFTRNELLESVAEFYNGPGARYKSAASDFFLQHPNLRR